MNTNKNIKNDIMDIMAGVCACITLIIICYNLLPALYDNFTKTNNKKKSFETDKPNFIPQEFCSYFQEHEICKNICEYDYSSYRFLCNYSLTTQKQKDDYNSFKTKEEEKEKIKKNKNAEKLKNIPNIKI